MYDWEGNEINHLAETPILDDCLQPGGTAVLGPLWVSVGEGFSPSATIGYITSIRQVIKIKLQDAERYYEELSFALNDEKEKVTITAILSMSEEELYETQELAEKEIEQLKATLRTLNEKVKAIKTEMDTEQAEGSNYRMSHIKEISADDRIVGLKGIRLRVYENGFYDQDHTFYFNLAGALRGVNNDKELVLKRLLDELSVSHSTRDAKNPKIAPVAKKIFDEYGTEMKDVTKLKYDQEIWVSHGEPYIQPFTYCVQALFDRASGYTMTDGRTAIIREQLTPDHIKDIKEDYREWNASIGFPATYEMADSMHVGGDEYVQMQLTASGLDSRAHYIQAKEKKNVVLYPEVIAYKKVPKGDKAVWPSESQVWVISKKGYIYSKSMPSLCLAASDMKTEIYLPGREETTAAFVVTLQKYMASNPHQQWIFNNDGTISSVAHQELVLTYSGAKLGDEENYKQPEGVLPGHKVYLIITDRLSKKEAVLQRFALKQERFDNLGQWKFTDASNPEWNKLAYSWPVKEDGMLNEEYDWPMEGYIIPNAPPLHKGDRKQSLSGAKPMKLMVVKNGERDIRTAVPVVGPNLTNFTVSCGEPWTDPRLTRAEQQRRFLLSQLSQDVAKIRQFCALRNPENYVIEIDGSLSSNTGIVLNKQWDTEDEERDFGTLDSQSMTSSKKESSKPVDEEDEDDDVLGKSAHAISHQKSEQRLNSLKWPWERLVNVDKSLDMEDPEAQKYTDREMYERYKPRTIPKTPRKTLQQFVYEDGYIACAANRELVLGVLEQEGRVNQVMLVKRNPGDINQIWMMKENGEIRSKHNNRLVFTVAMPANEPFAEDEDGRPLTFSRCPLTIQGRRTNVYGKAHQRWHYNADTGYIHAFHTNRYDKEITAANKADVCTYSIAAQTKIDQPGYLAEVPVATPTDRISVREIMVCTSCARAMRGRYKLQKLPDGTEFICAMGEAKKLKLQQIGSFRVLNGKVDLSTHEAGVNFTEVGGDSV
ncbi:hypothetical protein KUTeg_023463 [Tegillarca granosa]|uniref:Uncharacterized protein n=1 Tax=Tegillarca granosa TaxID=220873 RepID=A0ABQ9E1T0_TEGGR|nr:hypothetical protein KUTeg_023463 [Tegillarca granosa]